MPDDRRADATDVALAYLAAALETPNRPTNAHTLTVLEQAVALDDGMTLLAGLTNVANFLLVEVMVATDQSAVDVLQNIARRTRQSL